MVCPICDHEDCDVNAASEAFEKALETCGSLRDVNVRLARAKYTCKMNEKNWRNETLALREKIKTAATTYAAKAIETRRLRSFVYGNEKDEYTQDAQKFDDFVSLLERLLLK